MSAVRSFTVVVLALGIAVGAAACGGDDSDGNASGSAPTAGGAFPVTVEHKYGETTIETPPERVVTVGLSDHEPLVALGVVPVGVDDWFLERPFGDWPWFEGLWGDSEPTIIGERDDFNFEQIAALDPDLIIGMYSGMTEDDFGTLSEIAPTVAQPVGYEDYAAPWQDMTLLAGRSVGLEDDAQQLIDDAEARFAEVRAEHPEFAEQTVAVVDPYEPGQYAVFAPHDPKVVFMQELGFVFPEALAAEIGDEYAIEISSERLDLIDLDRVIFLTSDASAEDVVSADPVYANLGVARDDRALFIPYETNGSIGGALSYNGVLSIPYAIDEIIALLTEEN